MLNYIVVKDKKAPWVIFREMLWTKKELRGSLLPALFFMLEKLAEIGSIKRNQHSKKTWQVKFYESFLPRIYL